MSELDSHKVYNLLLHHHQRRGGMTRNSGPADEEESLRFRAANSFLEQCVEFRAISSKSAPRDDFTGQHARHSR
jgi:hypothetical protein